MEEKGTESVKERTIGGELGSLEEITLRLTALVFGEKPKEVTEKTPVANDKLTRVRNKLQDVVKELRRVASRLEIIE